MTVCDIHRITISSKGEPIPECDELPPPGDFFAVSSRTVWEMPCDETSDDEPINRPNQKSEAINCMFLGN